MLTIITGQPWWLIFLFFVPFVNYVVGPYVSYHLSKRFGFGIPFIIGLVFLPFIFYPILAFGNALYIPLENKETEGGSIPLSPSLVKDQSTSVSSASIPLESFPTTSQEEVKSI